MALKDLAQVVIQAVDQTAEGTKSAVQNLQGVHGVIDGLQSKLAALGGLLGITAFAAMVKNVLEQVAALRQLEEQYGATAENLSLLREAHRLAGVEFGVLDGVLGKLSKNLVASREPASVQAEALRALGVSALDAAGNLKKPDEVLLEIGRNLPKYADGTEKVAALQALLGKEAAKYIPVLNELSAAEEYRFKLTGEQTKAADEFEKGLVKLGAANRGLMTAIGVELAPVLNDLLGMFLRGQKESDSLRGTVLALAKDGSLQEWFRTLVLWTSYAVDGFQYVWRAIQTFATSLGAIMGSLEDFGQLIRGIALIMSGQFIAGSADVREALNRMKAGFAGTLEDIRQMWNQPVLSDRVEQALYGTGKAAEDTGTKLGVNFTGGLKAAAAKMSDFARELEALIAKLMGLDSGLNADFTKSLGTLNHALVLGRLGLSEYMKLVAILIQQQPVWKKNAEDIAKAEAALAAEDERVKKEIEDLSKAADRRIEQLAESNELLRLEAEAIGKTRIERELDTLEVQKRIALKGAVSDEQRLTIEQLYEQRKAYLLLRDAREEAFANQTGFWNDLASGAGSFARSLKDGVGGALDFAIKRAKDFGLQLLDIFAQRFVLQIGASLTGSTALASQASQVGSGTVAGAASNWLGTGISAIGNATGITGAWGSFSAGWQGATLAEGLAGPTTIGAAGLEGVGASMSSWMAGLGATGWGLIIVAAVAVVAALLGRNGGGPKEGGSFMGTYGASGFVGGVPVPGSDNGRFYTPSGQDSIARQVADAVNTGFRDMVSLFGGTAGDITLGFGLDADPRGNAPSRLSGRVIGPDGRVRYSVQDRSFDDKATQQEVALATQQMILAGLQASDLPEAIANVLSTVAAETASQEQIQRIFAIAQAVGQLTGKLTEALDPGQIVSDASRSAIAVFRLQGEELQRLAKSTNLSTESLGQLITATGQYRSAAAQLILQFQQARETIGGTIEGAIRDIRFSVLDRQGQYNFLQQEASQLAGGINSMEDANAIIAAVNQATQLSNQAFGFLSEDERRAKAEEFIRGLEDLRKAADDRLKELQERTTNDANAQLRDMREAITELTRKQKETSDQDRDTANINRDAANTFSSAVRNGTDVRVGITVSDGNLEVQPGGG